MPRLRAGHVEHRGGRQRLADVAARDRPQRRLHARAQHGVRGARDAQAAVRGVRQERRRGVPVEGERLLAPHVLARGQDAVPDLGVHRRDGEVDDHVDVVPGQQLVHRARRRHAVGLRLGGGPVEVEVGDEPHLDVGEPREVRQVLVRDVAGPDHADARGGHRSCSVSHASDPAMPSNTSPR
nr:hypothetical protein GCM10025730_47670 [Promicromonospora thailandica]